MKHLSCCLCDEPSSSSSSSSNPSSSAPSSTPSYPPFSSISWSGSSDDCVVGPCAVYPRYWAIDVAPVLNANSGGAPHTNCGDDVCPDLKDWMLSAKLEPTTSPPGQCLWDYQERFDSDPLPGGLDCGRGVLLKITATTITVTLTLESSVGGGCQDIATWEDSWADLGLSGPNANCLGTICLPLLSEGQNCSGPICENDNWIIEGTPLCITPWTP